jgi:hypothetical protein
VWNALDLDTGVSRAAEKSAHLLPKEYAAVLDQPRELAPEVDVRHALHACIPARKSRPRERERERERAMTKATAAPMPKRGSHKQIHAG